MIQQVGYGSPRAQYFAVEALGKLGNKKAFRPLIKLLVAVKDSDPHLRHGIMYALSKLNSEQELADLHKFSDAHVRIGAVVALRHMASPLIAQFLNDGDSLVVMEAARAIHDDFFYSKGITRFGESVKFQYYNIRGISQKSH